MSSVYCLGFRQKNWHASAKCSAQEAPPLNSTYYCRKGGEDFSELSSVVRFIVQLTSSYMGGIWT